MAVNSAVKQALASIEECEELGPGNQITVHAFSLACIPRHANNILQKLIIVNSSGGWLSEAFNDTVYDYLANGFPDAEVGPGVSDEDYSCCHFRI